MNKVLTFPNAVSVASAGRHFSYVKLHWEPGYENYVRQMCAGEGLPQDKLIYAFITINSVTGMACEFGWESGRKDVHAVIDLPLEQVIFENGLQKANEMLAERNSLIETLKEQYHEQGFEHGGSQDGDCYEGGFAEFARNFERATGRVVAPAGAALLRGELRATA